MSTYTEEAYFLTSAVHVEPSGFKSAAVSFEHDPKLDANIYADAIANVIQKYHPHLEMTYLCSSTDDKSVFVQYQISGVGHGKLESMMTDTKDVISSRFLEVLAKSQYQIFSLSSDTNCSVMFTPPETVELSDFEMIARAALTRNGMTVGKAKYV
ncbi:MAG: hypothetical protein U1E36_04325 [Rickettsiales bacterium]